MSQGLGRKEAATQRASWTEPGGTIDMVWAELGGGAVPLGGFPGGSVVKNLPADAGDVGDVSSTLGREGSPGEGNGNPVFLPGKSHGQRSLAVTVHRVATSWIEWLSRISRSSTQRPATTGSHHHLYSCWSIPYSCCNKRPKTQWLQMIPGLYPRWCSSEVWLQCNSAGSSDCSHKAGVTAFSGPWSFLITLRMKLLPSPCMLLAGSGSLQVRGWELFPYWLTDGSQRWESEPPSFWLLQLRTNKESFPYLQRLWFILPWHLSYSS